MEIGRSRWAVVGLVPLDRYGEAGIAAGVRDLDWVSKIAMAHEAVVEHFSRARGATVVPMKLFTMFSSAERLVQDLRSHQAGISATIARIRGAREWGVRVLRAQPTGRPASRSQPIRSGAAFLAAKKQARDDARLELEAARHAADGAFRLLATSRGMHAGETTFPDGATAPPLLDAAFLVPDRTDRAVSRRGAPRLCRMPPRWAAVTLTGPWPAYNFVGPSRARR